jgi:site-specific recombinase XerD
MEWVVALALVSSRPDAARDRSAQELADFEQEIVDQYALSMAAAGLTDAHIASARSVIVSFVRFVGRPLWECGAQDADRFLIEQRRQRRSVRTVAGKAGALARFYAFVEERYQGEIRRMTGSLVAIPIDEYNRPASALRGTTRVPPSDGEVETLFGGWGPSLLEARKFKPAARNYFAASLWRRLGLRITETVMLDVRDWRPDLGARGKVHVRFGKGSRGRGPKPRLVPAINGADVLIDWWLAEVRPMFPDGGEDPDAPMLPSERHDETSVGCSRVCQNALRDGLQEAVGIWLPPRLTKITPHVLRHYCASSLYGRGMDLKAVQELLGHEWLSTTTTYVHVHSDHIDRAWEQANARVSARFADQER